VLRSRWPVFFRFRGETIAVTDAPFRAFSLLLCTGKCSEVRLFLRKSRAEAGCPVYTRSENALGARYGAVSLCTKTWLDGSGGRFSQVLLSICADAKRRSFSLLR